MVTTSCGIASGASICARSSSSFRASATGELAKAGCSSSLSIRSASSSLMMIAGLVIAYSMLSRNLSVKENPRRKGQGLRSYHHTESCRQFEVMKRTFSVQHHPADGVFQSASRFTLVANLIEDKLCAAVTRVRLGQKSGSGQRGVDGRGVERDLHLRQIGRITVAG